MVSVFHLRRIVVYTGMLTVIAVCLVDWSARRTQRQLVPELEPGGENAPTRKVDVTNCSALFLGDYTESSKALAYMRSHPKQETPDEYFIELGNDCQALKARGYTMDPLTKEEAEFPIAFGIFMYRDVEQTEKLLRALYRPQNSYCIHIDNSTNATTLHAMAAIASCFDNVRIASKLEYIIYAGFSRLQAELNCMKDVLEASSTWKYYLNVASEAFPIKTNAEIVKILKSLKGANDLESFRGARIRQTKFRFKYHFEVVYPPDGGKPTLKQTTQLKDDPPHGILIARGGAYGIFSRPFVQFALTDPKAIDLLEWSRDTYSPDEIYWATLNQNRMNLMLRAPGGYRGTKDRQTLASFASWCGGYDPCYSGRCTHDICIFGVRDLPRLVKQKDIFANKFYKDFQYLTLDCLEEYLHNKTVFGDNLPMDYYEEYQKSLASKK